MPLDHVAERRFGGGCAGCRSIAFGDLAEEGEERVPAAPAARPPARRGGTRKGRSRAPPGRTKRAVVAPRAGPAGLAGSSSRCNLRACFCPPDHGPRCSMSGNTLAIRKWQGARHESAHALPYRSPAASPLLAGAAALVRPQGRPRFTPRPAPSSSSSMLAMAGTGAVIAALEARARHGDDRDLHLLSGRDLLDGGAAPGAARRAAFEVGATARRPGLRRIASWRSGLIGLAEPDGRLDSLPAADPFPVRSRSRCWPRRSTSISSCAGASPAPQRIARHLWRMCTALLIAAFSFFLGQQDEYSRAASAGSPLLVRCRRSRCSRR